MTDTPAPAVRKPWHPPRLERADVVERTAKKDRSPSDGSGQHALS